MHKNNQIPEYTFQIWTHKEPQEVGQEQSLQSYRSEKGNTVISETDTVDMFSFTPVINSNYHHENSTQPVHERLIKAGEYYNKKLTQKREDQQKAKQKEENMIIQGKEFY